jgi:hypothetical protein
MSVDGGQGAIILHIDTSETTSTSNTPTTTPLQTLMEEQILNGIRDQLVLDRALTPPLEVITPKEEVTFEPSYAHLDLPNPLLEFDGSVREFSIQKAQVLDLRETDKPTDLFVQNCLKFFRREWKHISYREKFEDTLLTDNVLFETSQFSLLPRRTTVPPEVLSSM